MNILTSLGIQTTKRIDPRVALVLEYARIHFSENLPLAELAKVSDVSIWHICRLFRLSVGLSSARCIKLWRFANAAELLATTNLSVKQVMASVGLNDESHFVRNFQAQFGISPMRYRANAVETNSNKIRARQY